MKKYWRRYAAWLVVLWVAIIASVFWLYQFRWISAYPQEANYPQEQWVSFSGSDFKNPWPDNKQITVAHIIDPQCPCSRFAYPHIAKLEKDFTKNIKFISLDIHSTNKQLQVLLQKIPASPAALIWDTTGKLAYFGPYSSGMFCGEGRDMVRLILNQLQQRINPEWIQQEIVGCFCPLPAKPKNNPNITLQPIQVDKEDLVKSTIQGTFS